MLFDIVVAVIIVAVAAVLGIVVHPIPWVIVIAAALWLFGVAGLTPGSESNSCVVLDSPGTGATYAHSPIRTGALASGR